MTLGEALKWTDEDGTLVAVNLDVYSYGYTRNAVFNIKSDGTASLRRDISSDPLDVPSFKYQDGWSIVRIRDGRWERVE